MIIYIWYNLLGLRWVMIKIRTCIIFCHLSKMIRMGNKLPSLPCVDDMVHYIIPVFTNKLVTLATYIYLNQRDLSTSPTRPSLVTSSKIMVFQDHVAAIQPLTGHGFHVLIVPEKISQKVKESVCDK